MKKRTDWQVTTGKSSPMGASRQGRGCNFALYAPNARALWLRLYDNLGTAELRSIQVMARTGAVWHIALTLPSEAHSYDYLIETHDGHRHVILDPYAKALSTAADAPSREQRLPKALLGPALAIRVAGADARPARPCLQAHQRVVYEAHVKGLSKLHPQVSEMAKGTYLGSAHPAILAHLKGLGVTTVQFLPLFAFMSEPAIFAKGLTNYWGYNPIAFFAPEPRYASKDAIAECRAMIDAYHKAGLEVILDVVLNHSAEGDDNGTVIHFKAMDPHGLYHRQANGRLANYSGCGNSLNMGSDYILTLCMDALRYWVQEMGVDGFRFDLAASLGRDQSEFSSRAGFLRAIAQDPVLSQVVLIAEPWDLGPGGYRLGDFSAPWLEVNDKYRDTVRGFWRGDAGLTSEFATRLFGSRDRFDHRYRAIQSSVNHITYHDGFTLQDLVSYQERHNQANQENNRDGHGHNLSCNHGVEGPSQDEVIKARRDQHRRNLFATLLLSQGTPHILGGDEIGRSQQGNNNAYCQDNSISWLDWQGMEHDFLAFCRQCIALRGASPLLSNLSNPEDAYVNRVNVREIHWYRPDGEVKQIADWHNPENQAFAVALYGQQGQDSGEHWLLAFNASQHDVVFTLPTECHWQLKLSSAPQQHTHVIRQGGELTLKAQSLSVLAGVVEL